MPPGDEGLGDSSDGRNNNEGDEKSAPEQPEPDPAPAPEDAPAVVVPGGGVPRRDEFESLMESEQLSDGDKKQLAQSYFKHLIDHDDDAEELKRLGWDRSDFTPDDIKDIPYGKKYGFDYLDAEASSADPAGTYAKLNKKNTDAGGAGLWSDSKDLKGVSPDKVGAPDPGGFELTEKEPAKRVGADLMELADKLAESPEWAASGKITEQSFGNLANLSDDCTKKLDELMTASLDSLLTAASYIDGVGTAVTEAVAHYGEQEEDVASNLKESGSGM